MTVLRRRRDSDSEPEPEGYVPPPPQASLGDALAQALNQVRRLECSIRLESFHYKLSNQVI